jgi:hypothetical protein
MWYQKATISAIFALLCLNFTKAQNRSNLELFWSYGKSPSVYPSRALATFPYKNSFSNHRL